MTAVSVQGVPTVRFRVTSRVMAQVAARLVATAARDARRAAFTASRAAAAAPIGSPSSRSKSDPKNNPELLLTISQIAFRSFEPYLLHSYRNVADLVNDGEVFQPFIKRDDKLLSKLVVTPESVDVSSTSMKLVTDQSQYSALSVRSFAPPFDSVSHEEPIIVKALNNYNVLFNLSNQASLVQAELTGTYVWDKTAASGLIRSFIFVARVDPSLVPTSMPIWRGWKSTGSTSGGGSGYVVKDGTLYQNALPNGEVKGLVNGRREVVLILSENLVDMMVRLNPTTPEQLWRAGKSNSGFSHPSERQQFEDLGMEFIDRGGKKNRCSWLSAAAELHYTFSGKKSGLNSDSLFDLAGRLQNCAEDYGTNPFVLFEFVFTLASASINADGPSMVNQRQHSATIEQLKAVSLWATEAAYDHDSEQVALLRAKFHSVVPLRLDGLPTPLIKTVFEHIANNLTESVVHFTSESLVLQYEQNLSKAWRSAFSEFKSGCEADSFARFMTSQMLSYSGFAVLATIHATGGGQSVGLTFASPPPPVLNTTLPIIASFYETGHYFQATGVKSDCTLAPLTVVNDARNDVIESFWKTLQARANISPPSFPAANAQASTQQMEQLLHEKAALEIKIKSFDAERLTLQNQIESLTQALERARAAVHSSDGDDEGGADEDNDGDDEDAGVGGHSADDDARGGHTKRCSRCNKPSSSYTLTANVVVCEQCSIMNMGDKPDPTFVLTCSSCKTAFKATNKKHSECKPCFDKRKKNTDPRLCSECKVKHTSQKHHVRCVDCHQASKLASSESVSSKSLPKLKEKVCANAQCSQKFTPVRRFHRFCHACGKVHKDKSPGLKAISSPPTQAPANVPALTTTDSAMAQMLAIMNEARESMTREREQFEASLKEAESKRTVEREEKRKQDEAARNTPPIQQPLQSYQQPAQFGYVPPSSYSPSSFQPFSAPYLSMQMPYTVAAMQQPQMPYPYSTLQQPQQQMGSSFAGGSYQWVSPSNGLHTSSQSFYPPHQFFSVPCPTNRMSGYGMGSQ